MSDSDDDSYGPSLPPGYQDSKRKHSSSSSEDDSYGPALPANLKKPKPDLYGPALPKKMKESKPDLYGPALPKKLKESEPDKSIGPVLPPHLQHLQNQTAYSSDSDSNSDSDSETRSSKKQKLSHSSNPSVSVKGPFIGPAIPDSDKNSTAYSEAHVHDKVVSDEDDDDDAIGPSLYLKASEREQASAAADFDERAQKMKDRLEGKIEEEDGPKARESWMTELPSNMGVKFGLENRQFRKNAAPEQDSSWTETPQDKERREKEGKKSKKQDVYVVDERANEMAQDIERYNKKNRPKSLLEMHQKKIKKEKKKEKKKSKKKDKDKDKEKPNERRPFDRDVDLQVNKLDEAQKRAIIKRSQELGSRFKTGGMGTSFL